MNLMKMDNIYLPLVKTLLSIQEKHPNMSLIDLALHHRVLPLIARQNADELQKYFTEEEIKELYILNEQNKQKTMKRVMELCSLAKLFNENKIEFLVLKGIPLSMELYGDIGIRPSKDIDILIRKEDAQKVIHLLKTTHDIECEYYLKYAHHFHIKNKKNNVQTEVHTRLFDNKYLAPEINPFENKRAVKVLGIDMPVLSYENTLLFLMIHGSVHRYFRLMWLTDIYTIASKEQFDFQKAIHLFGKYKMERILASSLLTCNKIFSNFTYPDIRCFAQKDKNVEKIIINNLKAIHTPRDVSKRGSFIFECRKKFSLMYHLLILKNGFKYKFYIYEKNFFAKHNMVTLPLPEKLHFLYIFIHSFLCVYRWANARYLKKV